MKLTPASAAELPVCILGDAVRDALTALTRSGHFHEDVETYHAAAVALAELVSRAAAAPMWRREFLNELQRRRSA